jgi:glycosyltransferase involved in cell wall biosynthesis
VTRILHVIDSLHGSGGAENRLVDEVLALAALDGRFDQAVVRLFESDALDARLHATCIPVHSLGLRASRAGRSWPWAALKLRRLVRRWRPDVVHTSLFSANLVGQLAATSCRVPVVSTFNRSGELYGPLDRGWRAKVLYRVASWSDRRGDVHYRAVSEHARRTNCAATGLDPTRCTVVPRAVQLDPATITVDRRAFGLPEAGPLFVDVARRVPEKGLDLLVRAFAKVRAELPDSHLAIAGAPGSADGRIRTAMGETGLADRVHLLGYRPDARSLVASADVFAFSSVSEGSPGAVAEALTIGVPVAAFAIPAVVELTDGGRHAWLATASSGSAASSGSGGSVVSVDALADAMVSAYTAPDRTPRVQAAQTWARRFRLDAVAGQLGDLLEARARGRAPREAT